jgi:hypothetical protein
MMCKECKHWQGTKYSEWGDCHRVVAQLQPLLLDCYQTNEYGTIERFFTVPFDPHDAKYWSGSSSWRKLYNEIPNLDPWVSPLRSDWKLPEGVRVIVETKDDIIFDNQNGERIGKLKVKYFQTNKNYDCEENV